MTREEKHIREDERLERCRDDTLLFCAGAGVCNAGLITLMASADAFAARLAASTQYASELSTLQLRQLALSLADMQPSRTARTTEVGVRSVSRVTREPSSAFYGAPVVT
ncbi:hypothetical protein [Brevundimonas sp.]|jgi:hypothetical protein|uniref:hypothetical protein n=1 Tax=Brevundimonas sp. TaxID=1871086 RepID=UPI0018077205|nr:hypothetical protein [Brevundimonas sp.]MBA4806081.1 hypothetical protein [Brevundimonas sp.]